MAYWLRLPFATLAAAIAGAVTYASLGFISSPYLFGEYSPLRAFLGQVQLWTEVGFIAALLVVVPTAIVGWKKKVKKSSAATAAFSSCVAANLLLFFGLGAHVNTKPVWIVLGGLLPGTVAGLVFIGLQYLILRRSGPVSPAAEL